MVTGLFPDRDSAEDAYRELSTRGYSQDDVNLVMSDETRQRYFSGDQAVKTDLHTKATEGAGIGAGIGGTLGAIAAAVAAVGTSIALPGLGLVIAGPLAAALVGAGAGGAAGGLIGALIGMGIPEETVERYEKGIKEGGILMGINPKSEVDREHFKTRWDAPHAAKPMAAGVTSRTGNESGTIPVIEESLEIGKREVELGTVHVKSHVVETPVTESVTLREEHAAVERRPVDRPASVADLDAFKEETIEIRQTAERAVVSKTARVVEEIVVGKTATTTTQEINDTVRKTVVDIERDKEVTGTAEAYRDDFQNHYAITGARYEDYAPAYEYGSTLANDKRYANRSWDEIEISARSDWQAKHPGSDWERFKAAARHGWTKVTGQR
nr:YsnF/AvaK domain-containing protein [uncultured Noviherbaspirillum sp.]